MIPNFCPLSRPLHESLSVCGESSRIQKDRIASATVVLETFLFFTQPFFSIEEGTRLILVLQVVLLEGLVVKTMAPEREVATSC